MSSEEGPLFRDIRQEPAITSTGILEVPVLYRDGSLLGLVYQVKPEVAARVISRLPLEPFLIRGKACVLLCIFEYRSASVASYNEVGLAVLVKRTGSAPSTFRFLRDMASVEDAGLYVLSLPVTTEESCAAGTEIWGFPKYVTGITTAFNPDGVHVEVQGEFTLNHTRGAGISFKGFPFVTFTSWNERLLRTVISVDHRVRFGGASSVKIEIAGEGPTSGFIRKLELDTLTPSLAFRTDALQAVLPQGKDVGECRLPMNRR